MSAPVTKRAARTAPFADGSFAVYRQDLGRWAVAAGADAAMNNPEAECEAAEFVRLQNRRLVAPAYTSAETIERLIAGLNAAFAPAAQLAPACGSAFLPHPSGDKR